VSVQFGRWNFDDAPPDRKYIESVARLLVPYGPDGQNFYCEGGLNIVYGAFHTTIEAQGEAQPLRSTSGALITWDGRLDNRNDLSQQLRCNLEGDCPDVLMVATAYEKWGTDCFGRLIGDWAVSIWNPCEQLLILAKDPIGTRPLYYCLDKDRITWSSLLEPLVLCADRSFDLNEEYVAGWLAFFPSPHLTPYIGICSVPPSSLIHVTRKASRVATYWDFNPDKEIRYRTDGEYEEHFRCVFGQAVRRRLRSHAAILAELSGGIDSSSIVCMADALIEGGQAETRQVDTISYYDDSEPNWNERPYFTQVEEKRGRTGFHIDVSAQQEHIAQFDPSSFAAAPSSRRPADPRFFACLRSGGYRVVLSGIGGDEVTGGVPTPLPELEDLLARVRLVLLAHQLKAWALEKRKPWIHLLFEALQGFLPSALLGIPEQKRPAPWLRRRFIHRHRCTFAGYESRLKLSGPLPSFQENLSTLDTLKRQLGLSPLVSDPLHEKRYPYLDRSLLEFLYAIPRNQLVRPGQRRSLMRRSLVGIVPDEILMRKRKAFVTRSPMKAISRESAALIELSRNMVSSSLGIVDPDVLREAIRKADTGQELPVVTLMRTLDLEFWLRGAIRTKVLKQSESISEQGFARAKAAPTVTESSSGISA